jgi:signal transduction histidine kinase
MDSLEQTIFEIGLIASAFILSFLSFRLRNKFSKGSLFTSPFAVFGIAGLLLGLTYSVDMSLDTFQLQVGALPFFLNFVFVVTLTFGVFRLYSRARVGDYELNKTKKELADVQTKLVKSERLTAIGELAGQIGHDLRNPLAGIKNGMYIIRKKNGQLTEEKRNEILGWIDDAIEDSDRIITSLVDYSSELNLQPEQCTPKSLVLHALSNIQVPDHLNIINNTTDDIKMFLDAKSMEKVFASIIKNAIDASPEKGTIKIQSMLKGQNIEISFTDSGIGIPENILPKLFTPLVTTKAKGMGMSLAICRRIVESHDGKITVESTVGKGTTFTINLPIKLSKSEFMQVQMFTGIEMKQATVI